jgi:hypothetical protein
MKPYKLHCDLCDLDISSNVYRRHLLKHGDVAVSIIRDYDEMQEGKVQRVSVKINDHLYKCSDCDFISENVKAVNGHYWRKHSVEGLNHKATLGLKLGIKV